MLLEDGSDDEKDGLQLREVSTLLNHSHGADFHGENIVGRYNTEMPRSGELKDIVTEAEFKKAKYWNMSRMRL